MEVGIMEEELDECTRAASEYPYDFIIGSFHSIGKENLYRIDYENTDGTSLLERFTPISTAALRKYKDYDIAGHLT